MVGSIREVYRELQGAGYLISEEWLRERVKSGDLPRLVVGKNKSLISSETVREYIESRVGGQQHE